MFLCVLQPIISGHSNCGEFALIKKSKYKPFCNMHYNVYSYV